MHGHDATFHFEKPGPAVIPARVRTLLLAATAIGALIFLVALMLRPERAWFSFLTSYLYFMILGLGGVFLVALENITSATWSVAFRRIPEAMSNYLPVALLLILAPLGFGLPHLFEWARPGFHFLLHSKQTYFSLPFFFSRTLVALALWCVFGFWFRRNSLAQDDNPGHLEHRATFGKKPTIRGRMAALFLVVFGYSFTWVFVDWVMSLQANWDTTMWGVYGFAGMFQSSLALVLLLTVLMRRAGMFGNAVQGHHYVDLSRLLHAFSIFMVYIGFAQYGLIWYANYREETIFYYIRSNHGWGWVFLFLLFAKWVLPFTILMNQKIRRNERALIIMASLVLAAEWVDLYWLVMPVLHPSFYLPNWVEFGVLLGFLGLFGLMVTRYLSSHPTVPLGDPKLLNSIQGSYL